MKEEENKRMLALSCIVADLKTENMELEQRLHQIEDDYADVFHQLNEKDQRKDEGSSTHTLVELQQMQEQCDHPERMNNRLDRFVKAMHEFVIDKNLYVKKNNECPYRPGCIHVGSVRCMGCSSCLSIIEGHGVICDKRLAEAYSVFQSYE